jgi:hypothetical protein
LHLNENTAGGAGTPCCCPAALPLEPPATTAAAHGGCRRQQHCCPAAAAAARRSRYLQLRGWLSSSRQSPGRAYPAPAWHAQWQSGTCSPAQQAGGWVCEVVGGQPVGRQAREAGAAAAHDTDARMCLPAGMRRHTLHPSRDTTSRGTARGGMRMGITGSQVRMRGAAAAAAAAAGIPAPGLAGWLFCAACPEPACGRRDCHARLVLPLPIVYPVPPRCLPIPPCLQAAWTTSLT